MTTLKPILTEKSLNLADQGKYSFWVPTNANKFQIKKLIEETFGVNVQSVKTQTKRAITKRTIRGRLTTKSAKKKAIIKLKEGDKIDIFGKN